MAPSSLALAALLFSLMLQHGIMNDKGEAKDPDNQTYLYHICLQSSKNLSPNNSTTQPNLNNTSSPAIQTDLNSTLPSDQSSARPAVLPGSTLRFCRGDVPSSDCDACLFIAAADIWFRCSGTTSVIWYDHCEVKISTIPFLGQVDHDHGFTMSGQGTVSDPRNFNGKVYQLLFQLAGESFSNVNPPKYFAKGAVAVDGSTTIYGLTQCSPDLSSGDCWMCLQFILGSLPSCCDGKDGGRVVTVSCNFRYEIYPF